MTERRIQTAASFDPSDATVVCPHCLASNTSGEHFCRQCSTPLTSHATIDPMGQVQAEGDTYRKALDHPDKPIVVIGLWLLLGPTTIGSAAILIYLIVGIAKSPWEWPGFKELFGALMVLVIFGGMAVIGSILLIRATRGYVRLRAKRARKRRRGFPVIMPAPDATQSQRSIPAANSKDGSPTGASHEPGLPNTGPWRLLPPATIAERRWTR